MLSSAGRGLKMNNYIIDTNIITALFKKNESVLFRLQQALINGDKVIINGISYYEIKRGLLAAQATSKLSRFDLFCKRLGTLWLDKQDIFDEASSIYADLQVKGQLIPDADILIAALAKTYNSIVVTDNLRHFQRIPDLPVENWL